MKKHISLILFLLTMIVSTSVFGQYTSHATLNDKIKVDTLIDKKSGHKFIVDKSRIYITAIDENGQLIWKIDPVLDNKIEEYRTNRPTLVYFAFNSDRAKKAKEVI